MIMCCVTFNVVRDPLRMACVSKSSISIFAHAMLLINIKTNLLYERKELCSELFLIAKAQTQGCFLRFCSYTTDYSIQQDTDTQPE